MIETRIKYQNNKNLLEYKVLVTKLLPPIFAFLCSEANQPVSLFQENIFDLKTLHQETTLNWSRSQENDKVYSGEFKIIETNPDRPNVLLFKNDDTQSWHKIILSERGRKFIKVDVPNVE